MFSCQVPCPSLCPRVCSNSCPLSWWYYLTVSFSVALFSSCLQSFPVSGSFPMSQLFASGGQSIGASALVFPVSIQDWFPLGLMGLISSLSLGPSRVFSNTTIWKHQFFAPQPSFWSTNILGLLKIMFLSTKWGPILYFETYLEILVNIAQ